MYPSLSDYLPPLLTDLMSILYQLLAARCSIMFRDSVGNSHNNLPPTHSQLYTTNHPRDLTSHTQEHGGLDDRVEIIWKISNFKSICYTDSHSLKNGHAQYITSWGVCSDNLVQPDTKTPRLLVRVIAVALSFLRACPGLILPIKKSTTALNQLAKEFIEF